jgi:hypothetical protein
MIDVNSTAQLLGAFGVLDRPLPFLYTLFFPLEQQFDTEEVYFDQIQRARRLAPFVAPTVAGKPDRMRGYKPLSFKPAYVKPKHTLDPSKAMKRRAGERLLGEMTPEMRFGLALADNLLLEDDEISRREEWMATQLLLSGSMICQSEDHPAVVVDLGRNPAHTITLTGSLRWGQTGVDPLQNVRSWAKTTQGNSGFHPRTVIFDPLAGDNFINSPTVTKIMQSFRQKDGYVDLLGKVTGGAIGLEVAYLGSTPEFDFFQYQQLYTDESGTVQKFMPDNSVIMGSTGGAQGIRCYGAIKDRKAALRPMPRFPKVWDSEDPSQTFTMTQSAPMPLFGWADATFAAITA